MSNRTRYIILWVFGLAALICIIYILKANPEKIIPEGQLHPILKYFLPIIVINIAIALIIWPFLAMRGTVTPDYHSASKYMKAKSEFILYLLCLPGILIFVITVSKLFTVSLLGKLFAVFLLCHFIYNFVAVLNHRRQK